VEYFGDLVISVFITILGYFWTAGNHMLGSSLRTYLYFGTVMGLASSTDPESHAGRSVATGRAFHAAQVKGDDSDKRDTLVLHVGGWALGLKFYTVKFLTVETLLTVEAGRKHLRRRPSKNKDLRRFEGDEL
jgi:hypothetical protein